MAVETDAAAKKASGVVTLALFHNRYKGAGALHAAAQTSTSAADVLMEVASELESYTGLPRGLKRKLVVAANALETVTITARHGAGALAGAAAGYVADRLYTAPEVAKLLGSITDGSRNRIIHDIVERKLAPVGVVRLRALAGLWIRHPEKRASIKPFGHVGCPATASVAELEAFRKTQTEGGGTVGFEATKRQLLKLRREKCTARGLSSIGGKTGVCAKTVQRSMVLMASQPSARVLTKVVCKTMTRYTAGRSIIAAAVFAALQGFTHYRLLRIAPPWFDFKQTDKLRDLVMKANGGIPVFPIHPSQVLTTDDSTMVVIERKKDPPLQSKLPYRFRWPRLSYLRSIAI